MRTFIVPPRTACARRVGDRGPHEPAADRHRTRRAALASTPRLATARRAVGRPSSEALIGRRSRRWTRSRAAGSSWLHPPRFGHAIVVPSPSAAKTAVLPSPRTWGLSQRRATCPAGKAEWITPSLSGSVAGGGSPEAGRPSPASPAVTLTTSHPWASLGPRSILIGQPRGV